MSKLHALRSFYYDFLVHCFPGPHARSGPHALQTPPVICQSLRTFEFMLQQTGMNNLLDAPCTSSLVQHSLTSLLISPRRLAPTSEMQTNSTPPNTQHFTVPLQLLALRLRLLRARLQPPH